MEIKQKKFFKITNEKELHNGFQYQEGLNVLDKPFDEVGSCVPGGLYFTDQYHIFNYLYYGCYLREIILPTDDPDFRIVQDDDKWRANKIILGKKYSLCDVGTFEYLVQLRGDIVLGYKNVIDWACYKGHTDVVKYIVSLNLDINYDRALANACFRGDLEMVKYLVQLGADIRAIDDACIKWASCNGNLELIKYLISLGADISRDNYFSFVLASEYGNLDVIKYFASLDPSKIMWDNYALVNAAKYGHLDVVKYLVFLGADINYDGNRVIECAFENENWDVVKYLVSICSDPELGKYVLKMACKMGQTDLIQYFNTIGINYPDIIFSILKD